MIRSFGLIDVLYLIAAARWTLLLTLVAFLGETTRAMDDFPDDFPPGEIHHRFFYHLRCDGDPPPTWRHHERFGTGSDGPIAFDFFWATLPEDVPELIADQGVFIPHLLDILDP